MDAPALAQLRAVQRLAAGDPGIATSTSRVKRLGKVVGALERAAADLPTEALTSLDALLDPDVIGHPDTPDTVLGRLAAGLYRRRGTPGTPLERSAQRDLMDGLADLARAAGREPFWWQRRGARPWSRHTREPMTFTGHVVLRRELGKGNARTLPYRLRLRAALELLWCTGVGPESLVAADWTDLAPDLSTVRLTVNPPGRTAATSQEFELPRSAQAALRQWDPVRRDVIDRHLDHGAGHPANQALFICLRHTTGTYPDGTPRMVVPGLRITDDGLQISYAQWARLANTINQGQPGFPVPTDLYRVSRAGAARRR